MVEFFLLDNFSRELTEIEVMGEIVIQTEWTPAQIRTEWYLFKASKLSHSSYMSSLS